MIKITGIRRYIGLMFYKPKPNEVFIFKRQSNTTLHTFFCYTLKITYKAKDNTIIKEFIARPFRIFRIPDECYWIEETLPIA